MATETKILLVTALAITLNLGSRFVCAQATDTATARLLFKEAREASIAGNCAKAYPLFVDSYRLEPAVGTLLNIADCQRRQKDLFAAWKSFQKALDEMAIDDDRRDTVDSFVRSLEMQLPRLVLRLASTAPADSVIELDGQRVLSSSLGVALPVDSGRHSIVVKAPGHPSRKHELVVLNGETKEKIVSPGAVATPQTEAITGPVPAPLSGLPQYVTGGIGAVGLLTGVITRIAAFEQKGTIDSHCDDKKACDSAGLNAVSKARTYQTVSTVSLIVGATGIGVCLYLTLSLDGEKERHVAISPVLSPSTFGLAVSHNYWSMP